MTSTVFSYCRGHMSASLAPLQSFAIERDRKLHTSPLSSLKTSLALPPSTDLLTSSEATQPSVASGCHALVPTS